MDLPYLGSPGEPVVPALLGPAIASRRTPVPADAAGWPAEPPPPFVRPGWRPPVSPGWIMPEAEPGEVESLQATLDDLALPPEPEDVTEPGFAENVEPVSAGSTEVAETVPSGSSEDVEPVSSGFAEFVEVDDLGLVRGADWGLAPGAGEPERTDAAGEREALPGLLPEGTGAPLELGPTGDGEESAEEAEDAPREASPAAWEMAGVAAALERVATPEAGREEPRPVDARPASLEQAARHDPVAGGGEVPALQEVAGRLERIARALREGRPIELFASGAGDPLEVLIAGYALGYSEAYRRANEERRAGT